ncbi:MAG: hypothetical protein CMQ24_08260 [Gammaproteobacteria bacterium]|nr:hypothetical protein [Gammaproteobacteria bacterium]
MRIGIDLGGTKIEGILLDGDEIRTRRRIPTPQDDYGRTVTALTDLVAGLQEEAGSGAQLPVGIGTPGAISLATGLMKNCNSTCLNGMPLRDDLTERLGREVRIANDADCFALSEASDGAAAGAHSVFGVIVGTGVGGGLVYNGTLLQGVNAICGEWGHNPLPLGALQRFDGQQIDMPTPGRPCYCGRVDCVEAWLSGPAFARSYELRTGQSLTAAEIVGRAGTDDLAHQLLSQYAELLSLALSVVVNIFDPARVVLGGGMSNVDYLYPELNARLPRYVFSDEVRNEVVKARHGDSSGVRGAAWLWQE